MEGNKRELELVNVIGPQSLIDSSSRLRTYLQTGGGTLQSGYYIVLRSSRASPGDEYGEADFFCGPYPRQSHAHAALERMASVLAARDYRAETPAFPLAYGRRVDGKGSPTP
jgi:hypothetical protein